MLMSAALTIDAMAELREQLEVLRAENMRLREGINHVLGQGGIPEWAVSTLVESLDEWWMR